MFLTDSLRTDLHGKLFSPPCPQKYLKEIKKITSKKKQILCNHLYFSRHYSFQNNEYVLFRLRTHKLCFVIENGRLSGCLAMEAEPQLKPVLRFQFSGACFSRCSEVSSVAAVSSEQEQSSFSRSLSPGSYTWEESDAELDTEILERKACGGWGVFAA